MPNRADDGSKEHTEESTGRQGSQSPRPSATESNPEVVLDSSFQNTATIYAHAKRKEEWGLAILAFENKDRRSFQFQDGVLRSFKKGYYELMEPIELPSSEAPKVVKNLKSMLRHRVETEKATSGATDVAPDVDFGALHHVFKTFYENGFADEAYRTEVRGDGNRRLKRHRDPAIEQAQAALSSEVLAGHLANGDFTAIRDSLLAVMNGCDLVTKKQLEPLATLEEAHYEELATVLHDMLHGDGPYEARFERFVRALGLSGKPVSWDLATGPSALYAPTEHLHVKGTAFGPFVQRFGGTATGWSSRPSGWLYGRLIAMGKDLAQRLADDGDPPTDLLDVCWLVMTVFRPKGRALLDRPAAR